MKDGGLGFLGLISTEMWSDLGTVQGDRHRM